MFASARKAFGMIFDPALFGVVLKSFVLAFLLFAALFIAVQYGVEHLPALHWHWLNVAIDWLAPILVVVLAFYLGPPVAAIFASLFLDSVARTVEAKYYPGDAREKGAPLLTYLFVGLRLAAFIIVWSLALLPFDVALPIVGSLASVVVNGWLLGREYFELAALRHLPRPAVDAMRKRHGFGVLGAGLVIAVLAEIPIVNFIAPLFAAAFMVHVFKHYQLQDRPA
jgi:CysZ protein